MAFPYLVWSDTDVLLGGADTIGAAATIMASVYVREGAHLMICDPEGETWPRSARLPRNPSQPLQRSRRLALALQVGAGSDISTYSFRVDGIDVAATVDFGDGSPTIQVDDDLPFEHTFPGPATYRVTAIEGARASEAALTILEEGGAT